MFGVWFCDSWFLVILSSDGNAAHLGRFLECLQQSWVSSEESSFTCWQMAPVMVTGKSLTTPRPRFSLFLCWLNTRSSFFSCSSRELQYCGCGTQTCTYWCPVMLRMLMLFNLSLHVCDSAPRCRGLEAGAAAAWSGTFPRGCSRKAPGLRAGSWSTGTPGRAQGRGSHRDRTKHNSGSLLRLSLQHRWQEMEYEYFVSVMKSVTLVFAVFGHLFTVTTYICANISVLKNMQVTFVCKSA